LKLGSDYRQHLESHLAKFYVLHKGEHLTILVLV
jgi:hypothetical protein